MNKYDPKKTLWKGVKVFVYFVAPYIVALVHQFYPEATSFMCGTGLTMLENALKHGCKKIKKKK